MCLWILTACLKNPKHAMSGPDGNNQEYPSILSWDVAKQREKHQAAFLYGFSAALIETLP